MAEHSLGKGEVGSSILPMGTIICYCAIPVWVRSHSGIRPLSLSQPSHCLRDMVTRYALTSLTERGTADHSTRGASTRQDQPKPAHNA